MRGDRKCIVDAKNYNYCPHCKDNPNETWRFLFCSENCRDIYHTLEDWVAKKITSDVAREQLNNYTLPPLESMKTALRMNIQQIYKESENKQIEKPVEQKPAQKKRGRRKKILVNDD